LARQLVRRLPGYGAALADALGPSIRVVMEARQVRTMVGPQFGTINLADAASLFNRVCQPLWQLYQAEPWRQVVVLVDALDEAVLWPGAPTIVDLVLTRASEAAPPNLRFLATCRPDPDVIDRFPKDSLWDLVEDAVGDVGDVEHYARRRIEERAPEADPALAAKVAHASQGNFLYAEHALDYWLPRLDELASVDELDLPPTLDAIYGLFLEREFGAEPGRTRWKQEVRPLLATVGAAAERLKAQALAWLLEFDPERLQDALRDCEQYLSGERPDGPFGIYHQSFRDFLFDPERNCGFPADAAEGHARIARRYLDSYAGDWSAVHDLYGLRYTAAHLREAASRSAQPARHQRTGELVGMVLDGGFQDARDERVGDVTEMLGDLGLAAAAAAADDHPAGYVLAVQAALGLTAALRAQLRPGPLFELAATGEVWAAVRRLDDFPVDDHWRLAAMLTCAWHGGAANAPEARQVLRYARQRLQPDQPSFAALDLLAARVAADLEGEPPPQRSLASPPSEDLARAIVDQLGGTNVQLTAHRLLSERLPLGEQVLQAIAAARAEALLPSLPPSDYQPVLVAEVEGPLLVAFAAHRPDPGDRLMEEYITLQAANNYVHYRNRSLWVLLSSVLDHPDQGWVRRLLPLVVGGALAGGRLEFQECLPLTLLALRAQADPGAHAALAQQTDDAVAAAGGLSPGRTESDMWGAHSRRLGTLAEAHARLLDNPSHATWLLDRAMELPFGFAGFQAPSCLARLESVRVCDPTDVDRVQRALWQARSAAHNVQDPLLCARTTSRVNAMGYWWPFSGTPLGSDTAARLAERPSSAEFAAIHIVGETYQERSNDPASIPLPGWMRQARTLEDLSVVYERPLSELVRLNADQGLRPRDALQPGTAVRIPDPWLTPLLAARLAAEVLSLPHLSKVDRVAAIQRLVPLAAANLTALDAVLSRLLLAARPSQPAMLDILDAAVAATRPPSSSVSILPS
jgi:hypothetical protein